MLNQAQKDSILAILAPFQPKSIAVYGSRARGDERADSDLDLLVDFPFERQVSFFDVIEMEFQLEELLGFKVHITSPGSFGPRLWKHVEPDLIALK